MPSDALATTQGSARFPVKSIGSRGRGRSVWGLQGSTSVVHDAVSALALQAGVRRSDPDDRSVV